MRFIGFIILLSTLTAVQAQESGYQFSPLRQFDSIEPTDNTSTYGKLKYSSVFSNGHISFGGSYRGQYEYFKNEEFSFSPNRENGWYLQRLLLHSDIWFNDRFRLFGELGSSLISGKEVLAPVDRDELYVNQLFAQYNSNNITIKVGRENLRLGSQRLVDPREGPNVRWSFDQVSINLRKGSRDWQAFVASPVFVQPEIFDNRTFHNEEFLWGFYGNKILTGKHHLDLYYLGSHYETAAYALDTGEEVRHSLGIRHWKTSGAWQYDNELIGQFGTFGDRSILAWTISFNVKRYLNERNSLGLKTEVISGSTSEDRLGTFNPLYPRGAYFGRVARFGPSNLIDIHPYWTYRNGKFTMEIDYDVFWRYSRIDAVYGPAMNIVLQGPSERRFLAHQFGTIFNYEFNPFVVIELETNIILPGTFITDTDPGAMNLFHSVLTFEAKF